MDKFFEIFFHFFLDKRKFLCYNKSGTDLPRRGMLRIKGDICRATPVRQIARVDLVLSFSTAFGARVVSFSTEV